MIADRNDAWQAEVRRLLSEHFGVEDIAILLDCNPDDVRREVEILRAAGELKKVVR